MTPPTRINLRALYKGLREAVQDVLVLTLLELAERGAFGQGMVRAMEEAELLSGGQLSAAKNVLASSTIGLAAITLAPEPEPPKAVPSAVHLHWVQRDTDWFVCVDHDQDIHAAVTPARATWHVDVFHGGNVESLGRFPTLAEARNATNLHLVGRWGYVIAPGVTLWASDETFEPNVNGPLLDAVKVMTPAQKKALVETRTADTTLAAGVAYPVRYVESDAVCDDHTFGMGGPPERRK